MGRLGKLALNIGRIIHLWRLELWTAVMFCVLFFVATAMGVASARIGWIALGMYGCLVGIHQWTRAQKESEIRALREDVRKHIEHLRRLMTKAHEMHQMLIRQRAELAKASEHVEKSKGMLLAMGDVKNKFIAAVSHELRTPLTAIQEAVNIIAEGIAGPVSKKQKEFLVMAIRNVTRLTELLNSLLDLSRLESGGMKPALAKVPLEEMIFEAVNTIRPKAQKNGVELAVQPQWNLPAVLVDRRHVVMVLENLLDNAVKFSPAGGKAGISARLLEGAKQLEVCVWDTGCGINAESVEKLLGRFYQLNQKQDYTSPGAGLGLNLCKEIVTQLGGSIWLESQPGKGSKFYFTLLCHSDEAMLRTHFRNALHEAALKNYAVLHLQVQLVAHEALRRSKGNRAVEDVLHEAHRIVRACFRKDDRVTTDFTNGKIHIMMVSGNGDLKKRILKLDEDLHATSFFAGDEALKIQFVYGMARFPHDGEDLDGLLKVMDKQILSGGLDIADLPLDRVA